MTILYKLTDSQGRTWGATQWGEGVTHTAMGASPDLCSNGWLHAYLSPELAVLLNPIHADFEYPRLWLAEGEIGAREGQLKVGCKSLTTVREIALPTVTTEQRVRFAIRCALAVYDESAFVAWANGWLTGKDRSASAAWSAARSAADAARSAAESAAALAAALAAWSAAGAARSAARSAVDAVDAARSAAGEARTAAWSAVDAARSAIVSLDLVALAREALSQ